uniref:Cathepsin propeptide inhibitor domain-containing protein n=1 Tax=Oryza barthii TaxID=65489 RepID=A0A0D3FX27_9ORYZ
MSSRLASRAARLAAAAASRAARLIAAAASRAARSVSSKLLDDDIADRLSFRYSTEPPDDGKCVTAKDLESDQAVWALYERWCKSYNKKRDHAEMIRRFDIFKLKASLVHNWNNYVHKDRGISSCKKEKGFRQTCRSLVPTRGIRPIRRWGRHC